MAWCLRRFLSFVSFSVVDIFNHVVADGLTLRVGAVVEGVLMVIKFLQGAKVGLAVMTLERIATIHLQTSSRFNDSLEMKYKRMQTRAGTGLGPSP